jgi:hypothetical protein
MTTIARTAAPAYPVLDGSVKRHPVKALAESLKSDDLAGAKRAFVQIIRQAPPEATWNPDSGLANIGRALQDGDMPAARKAAQVAWDEFRSTLGPALPTPPVPRAPSAPSAPSTMPAEPEVWPQMGTHLTPDPASELGPANTGTAVGTRLNVVA